MKLRQKIAWIVLVIAVVGWPATAFTIASSEPQVVLGLSWIAIILTCALIVIEV